MALWTPSQITTAIWLDASDASTLFDATTGGSLVAADGAVARIEDKSGNARHFTQGTLASRPLRKTSIQNSLDVLRLDGSDDSLSIGTVTAFATDQIFDLFVSVWRNSATSAQIAFRSAYTSGADVNSDIMHGLFRENNLLRYHARASGGAFVGSDSSFTSGASMVAGTWAADNTVTQHLNGTAQTAGTGATSVPVGHLSTTIGVNSRGVNANPAAIDLCEWVRIVGGVTAGTRQLLEGYTAWKWGLQGSLPNDHTYKNGPPVIGGSAAVHFFTFGY